MAHVLQDVHHLIDGFDEDSTILSTKDYIGLADPGSMSPGSLSYLESLIEDNKQYKRIDQHQLQYDKNNKHLDLINEYGSNSLERLGQTNEQSYTNRNPNKLYVNTSSSYEIEEDFQNDFMYCDNDLDYHIDNIDDKEYKLWESSNTQLSNKDYNDRYERNSHIVNSIDEFVNVPRKPRSNSSRARLYKHNTTNYKDRPRRLRKINHNEHRHDLSPRSKDILKRILNRTLEKNQHINTILGINSKTLYELLDKKNDEEVGKLNVEVSPQPLPLPTPQSQPQLPNSPIDGSNKDFEYLISELSNLGLFPSLNEVDTSMFDIDTSIFNLNISNFDSINVSNIYDSYSPNSNSDTSSHFDPNTSNFDSLDSLCLKDYHDRSEMDEVEEDTRTIEEVDDEARYIVELDDTKASQELGDAYITSTSKVLELYDHNLTSISETLELDVPLSRSTINNSLPSYNSKANSYILNEDECMALSKVTSQKSLSYNTKTTNAPNQENFSTLNTIKINVIQSGNTLFKSKSLKLDDFKGLRKIVDAQNKLRALQGLSTNTSLEGGSSSRSNNNDRWQTTPNSTLLDIALTYIDKPVPLEWKNMENPHLIGVCMNIFSNSQKIEAWNIMQNNQNTIDTSKINIWNPQLYMDDVLKTYNRYFPIVLNTSTKKVLAFDYRNNEDIDDISKDCNQKGWFIMPSLEWIKSPIIARVIAANDGLIVLDSKKPAISTIHINYKWVFYETQKLNNYIYEKDQSLLTIINPLTHDYMFLPPIPYNVFKKKIGYLSFSNAKDQNYRLFILGCEKIEPTVADIIEHAQKYGKKIPKKRPIYIVNFAIYSSIDKTWNHLDHFEHTKTNHFEDTGGHGNCAAINYRFYFGGLQVVPCLEKIVDDELPSIFYINCEKRRYQHLIHRFLLHGIGNIRIPEAPKLVRVSNNRIYAITREATLTSNIEKNVVIVEVLLDEDGTPNGKYALVVNGIMPEVYALKLFKNRWQKGVIKYEVYSSGDLIAFRVSQPQFVIYDVNKTTWRLIRLPQENNLEGNAKKNHVIVEGVYQPNWLAITLKD